MIYSRYNSKTYINSQYKIRDEKKREKDSSRTTVGGRNENNNQASVTMVVREKEKCEERGGRGRALK